MATASSRQFAIGRTVGALTMAGLAWLIVVGRATAQGPAAHFNHGGDLTPGAIGRRQLRRGGPLRGYVQPVEVYAPEGVRIALASDGQFQPPEATPKLVGMYISPVYRLRVTGIPNREGEELYPTIELIDRTYPPPGMKRRFPIPIQLTEEELLMALKGHFVTRVIYLENPTDALPAAQRPGAQHFHEISTQQNPLDVADALGRPVAILRMGSLRPGSRGPDRQFLFNSPAWVDYLKPNADAKHAQRGGRAIVPDGRVQATEFDARVPRPGHDASPAGRPR